MEAVLPYDVDALAYLGDGVLAMVEEDLLDDGDDKLDEVEGCHHTWLDRDLRVRHNEVVGEGMNSLLVDRDGAAAHIQTRNALVEDKVDSIRFLPDS